MLEHNTRLTRLSLGTNKTSLSTVDCIASKLYFHIESECVVILIIVLIYNRFMFLNHVMLDDFERINDKLT